MNVNFTYYNYLMKNLVFTVGVFLLITAVKSKFIQQQRISYPDHLLVKMHNEILEEIREALQYASDNITLEEIIPKMFNLGNPNPTYKFILPGKQPRQVIMKKSDFQKPFFPKLTEAYVQLSRLTLQDFPIVRKDDIVNQEISYIDPKFNNTDSLYNNSPGHTIDELNALQKNLQTERNFIQYMEVLNERGESLSIILNRKDQNVNRQKDLIATDTMERKKYQLEIEDDVHIYNNGTSDWEQLGLTGWSGNISIPTDFLQKNNKSEKLRRLSSKFGHKSKFSSRNSKKIVEVERTVAGNFLPPLQLNFLDDPKSIEIWDLPGKISNKLVKLISEENEAYKNMTNLLNKRKKIHWPVTNTRRLHKDVDVYIARANDPFGHSTNWRLRNSTDTINRNKRSVADLYSMIKCSTGCDPLIFKGYGCYCGFLGSGTPTDGIDRCCRRHDKCYEFSSCPSYLTYFVPYLWKCYRGRPLCAVNNGEWGGKGSCATRLCKCDLALSKCLRKFVCPRRRAVCRSSPVRMLQNVLMIV